MLSTPRNPRPEASAPVVDLDLDAQIALAEQAVIARDERIRRRTDVLVRRVKSDALRHAGGGLLVGLGTLGLTWWLNRRRGPAPAAPAAAASAPSQHSEGETIARDAGLSIAALLPLVWPYLPRSIRRSVSPGTASTVLGFISPLVARLFRRAPKPAAQGSAR
jgi:hypothetical protein